MYDRFWNSIMDFIDSVSQKQGERTAAVFAILFVIIVGSLLFFFIVFFPLVFAGILFVIWASILVRQLYLDWWNKK